VDKDLMEGVLCSYLFGLAQDAGKIRNTPPHNDDETLEAVETPRPRMERANNIT